MAEKKSERKKQTKKPSVKRPTKKSPKKKAKKRPVKKAKKRDGAKRTSRQKTVPPRLPTAKERGQMRQAWKMAEEYASDKEKTALLLQEAMEKAERDRDALQRVWDELMTLYRFIKAWLTGERPEIPWKTIVWVIVAIIYFVNPFDVIPDFIPLAGYVDDAAVIAYVADSVRGDTERFRACEKSHA